MRRHTFQRATGLLMIAAALAISPARGELRAIPHDDGRLSTILMTIVDHPDPVDVASWQLFGPTTSFVLNPDGAVRGDGRPDLIADPTSGLPLVAWSFFTGADRDVVFSTWDAEGWRPLEFVAESALDELDPRIAVDPEGRVLVTWWIPDEGVFFCSKHPASPDGWSSPVRIGDPGRAASRPSLLVYQGEVLVAYERESDDSVARELVVARQLADGGFTLTVVASTEESSRLDAILHGAGDLLWVDWKHGDGLFGHAIADGVDWSGWSTLVLSDRTWIDVEEARAVIRSELVLP